MKLTQQQIDIISTNENIKVNAIAGAGKTSTLIEYVSSKDTKYSFLYIAFNKSVKEEAVYKFSKRGLSNVNVQTAHSLAFKWASRKYGKLNINHVGIDDVFVKENLTLEIEMEESNFLKLSSLVADYISFYCNSKYTKIDDVDDSQFISQISKYSIVKFFHENETLIKEGSKELLLKMFNKELPWTHDFYLKLYHHSNPKLNYDYILFDEGQDASSAMLDVFLKQDSIKIIVGDTHQQIYGWRYAINSLENVDFPSYNLTNSFRFNSAIAESAIEVLKQKKSFSGKIIGSNKSINTSGEVGIIARTNAGLLNDAISRLFYKNSLGRLVIDKSKSYYFEGGVYSYPFLNKMDIINDIINLCDFEYDLIKSKKIRVFDSIEKLKSYCKSIDDNGTMSLIELVENYGKDLSNLIMKLKMSCLREEERHEADYIFSTVHKCKGMEYNSVILLDDFQDFDSIDKRKKNYDNPPKDSDGKDIDLDINPSNIEVARKEELNILYVALTRAKVKFDLEFIEPKLSLLFSNEFSKLESMVSKSNKKKKLPSKKKKSEVTKSKKKISKPKNEVKIKSDRPIRLLKVAKELNIGTSTITSFLSENGYKVENKPTSKLSPEEYQIILKEFT